MIFQSQSLLYKGILIFQLQSPLYKSILIFQPQSSLYDSVYMGSFSTVTYWHLSCSCALHGQLIFPLHSLSPIIFMFFCYASPSQIFPLPAIIGFCHVQCVVLKKVQFLFIYILYFICFFMFILNKNFILFNIFLNYK